MINSILNTFTLSLGLLSLVEAQVDSRIVGTWATKSKKVVTGPGFYDPVNDKLIEPELAGISYSFTADGYYEEAYYRAVSNPTTPQCPSSIMQWQHGTYTIPSNGSIVLTPIGVDGRQLTSSPCSYDNAIYIRYEQPELFKSYEVITDPFHNVPRLNLFQFDGSPMQPLYQIYNPPQMLPTQTLNPTTTAQAQATAKAKVKRDGEQEILGSFGSGLNNVIQDPTSQFYNADRWWWAGVGLTALGTVMYMLPTSV